MSKEKEGGEVKEVLQRGRVEGYTLLLKVPKGGGYVRGCKL